MNLLGPVSQIMSRHIISITKEDSIEHIENKFKAHKIHHLPVLENGEIVGMVSSSDLLFLKRGYDKINPNGGSEQLLNIKAGDIMTEGLAVMEPDDRLNIALAVFKKNLFHAIPIVANKELVGMVTTYDFIKHLDEDEEVVSEYK